MGKKWKKKVLRVEIPEYNFRRYTFPVEGNKRIILIDFRCIRAEELKKINYGARRKIKWQSPEQLKTLVDEYFASCYGYLYDYRTHQLILDENGEPRKGQVKPFTMAGLARHCHVTTRQLRIMKAKDIDKLGVPTDEDYKGLQYSDVMLEARQKIEEYAEGRLYDRDGFNGGRYVLDCAYKWGYRKELAEIKKMRKELEFKERELEMKLRMMAMGEDENEPINITIRRAGEDE